MCRLFGFRSVIPSRVHRSLLAAENALGVQSSEHPDGWGVAFYVDGAPHVTRSPLTAVSDSLFRHLSGVVSSETVLAHVRKATQGPKTVLNCHPFQYGRWVFAHNGDVPNYEAHREKLVELVAQDLRRFILGDTDSETLFFVFLTRLREAGALVEQRSIGEVMEALRRSISDVRSLCDAGASAPCLLTFMVTDGELLAATEGGKGLFWSSYKNRCSDREHCKSLGEVCEAPTRTGHVNHFLVSSEPLSGENVWIPFETGEIVAVDRTMHLYRSHVDRRGLPLLMTA